MNSPQSSPPLRHFPIGPIILGFAIFDFLMPPMTEGIQPSAVGMVWIGLCAGTIVGQFALLTIWAVVGPPRALVRLPLTTMLGIFLVAWLVAGTVVADGGGGPADEVAAAFLFLPLVLLSAQLPLWVLRLFNGGRIVRVDAKTGQIPTVQRQFGVRHLMGATVVVALAFGLASSGTRLVVGADEGMVGSGMIWGVLAAYCGTFGLLSLLVTLPCLWAGLGAENPRAAAVVILIYAALMILLLTVILPLLFGEPIPVDAVLMVCLASGSLAVVTLGSLYAARACGYRYQRGRRPKGTVATSAPSATDPQISAATQEAEAPNEIPLDEAADEPGDRA
jgi:hypothetical protein